MCKEKSEKTFQKNFLKIQRKKIDENLMNSKLKRDRKFVLFKSI